MLGPASGPCLAGVLGVFKTTEIVVLGIDPCALAIEFAAVACWVSRDYLRWILRLQRSDVPIQ